MKEVVLPFNKFPGVDPLLGPEMRSTGEVMGVGATFAEAYAKAELGCGAVFRCLGWNSAHHDGAYHCGGNHHRRGR